MKRIKNKVWMLVTLTLVLATACNDYPVDEDGLLITGRAECYVSNFDLLDTDFNTVKLGNAYIDTLAQVAVLYVRYGTPLNNLWPQVSMCEDTKLSPKITGRVDFTRSKMKLDFVEGDWSGDNATEQLGERIVANPAAFPEDPVCYSVIAGNRKIEKEYKFLIVERPLQ